MLLVKHYNHLSRIWGPSSSTSFFLHSQLYVFWFYASDWIHPCEFCRVAWFSLVSQTYSVTAGCWYLIWCWQSLPWWRTQDKVRWGFWHLIGLQPDHLVFPLMINKESPLIEFGCTKKLQRFDGRSRRLDLTLKTALCFSALPDMTEVFSRVQKGGRVGGRVSALWLAVRHSGYRVCIDSNIWNVSCQEKAENLPESRLQTL